MLGRTPALIAIINVFSTAFTGSGRQSQLRRMTFRNPAIICRGLRLGA